LDDIDLIFKTMKMHIHNYNKELVWLIIFERDKCYVHFMILCI
jgi:hypothetical protein